MFLADLRIAPACGTVELGHQLQRHGIHGGARQGLFEPDAVHAVLVAVQRKQSAVGDNTEAFYRIKHDVPV